MSDLELERRIAANRADYEAYFEKPCKYFVCPILGRDESVEMCRGHLVTLAQSDIWIPQRKDVDNFYGSVVEADLATIVEDRGKDPWQLLLDPTKRLKHHFTMEHGGMPVEFYFPKPSHRPVEGHTRIEFRTSDEETICNIGIKKSPDLLIPETKLNLIIERDFRPSVVAAMLKAAHLTMFRMLGYDHMDSPGGRFIGDILKQFFERHERSHSAAKEEVDRFFSPFNSMISPLVVQNDDFLRGTAEDNLLISCMAMTEGVFAIGVIVRVKNDRFCVFLPTDCGKSINTYFSFLKEPPKFVTARVTRFCDGSDGKGARWEADINTRVILLNQEMPVA